MNKVVRSIDVGYGNVKYVVGHADLDKDVVCSLFPARALLPSNGDISAVQGKGRDTVIVDVDGQHFEVGNKVLDALPTGAPLAHRTSDYSLSPEYMALVRGALHYMYDGIPGQDKVIDVLVLGLPVNTYDQHRVALTRRMVGIHPLPHGRQVIVKDVRVLAQPFGAFFNFLYDSSNAELVNNKRFLRQLNLIIDPGHYTFDWLVSREMVVNPSRSGAVFGGVSGVIEEISKSIAHAAGKLSGHQIIHSKVEDALRNDYDEIGAFAGTYHISEHLGGANILISQSVASMAASVGDGGDLDNIILVGGGAKLWEPALQRHFGKLKILTPGNSIYANVTGFQLAAERRLQREALAEAATSA
jgi:plasmid segregation protein ParM